MVTGIDRLGARVGEVQIFASHRARRRFAVHLVVAVAVLIGGAVLARPYLSLLTDADELRSFIRGFGVWAPLALVVAQALQVVAAPVPGQVLAVVGGYLFGAWWGTVYNMIGITIGSTVAFWLSRRFGRAYVETIVHEETLATFDGLDDDHVRMTIFFLFLVPGLPDDVVCFVGGLTRIPLWQLVGLAVVGRAPAFFLVNVIGDLLGTGRFEAAAVLATVFIAVTVLGYLSRDLFVGLLGGGRGS